LPFSAPDGGGSGPIQARLLVVSRAFFAKVQRSGRIKELSTGSVVHPGLLATAVTSPLSRSLTSTMLCGFLLFDEPRSLHRVVLSVAVGARRAVYSNLELSACQCGWSCAGCGKGPSCRTLGRDHGNRSNRHRQGTGWSARPHPSGDRPEASPEICHAECLSLSEGRYSRFTAGASGP
jgi:hypothetical protein